MATAPSRRPVAKGGMFDPPKASFSKETRDLLKVMMEESKLTNFQQRQIKTRAEKGQSLPLRVNPTSSAPDRLRRPKKSRPRDPTKQGLRTKDTIEAIVRKDDVDSYALSPTKYNSTVEKERLQNVMTFGSDKAPEVGKRPARNPEYEETEEEGVDRFEEVLREIGERQQFLDEMTALGQDKPHRNRIMTEISQRIRELEEIDKARSKEIGLSTNSS